MAEMFLVLVGYRYDACSKVVWKKLKTTVRGHDPSLGNAIASWSLDIHHTYFAEEGVVYLGNGGEMRLQDQPPMISTVMGDGELRHVTCADCDGEVQFFTFNVKSFILRKKFTSKTSECWQKKVIINVKLI